ncbi:hypothetical protein ABDI30_20560 [Paenibacillus cisolokensis]|uniref:hypothetical protein n=1 Tax=Paenibacillus cisolokensis TaxID=1658519 RepID=UPI003D2D4144
MLEPEANRQSEEIQKDRASDHASSGPVSGHQPDWSRLTSSKEDPAARESTMFDIDRMINEGLGGGNVTEDNGWIGASTTDTMKQVNEAPREAQEGDD